MSVVYFLLLVGVLVAIHEFGHFLAAKLLDFKVLRFSIGFGRPLVRVRGRETEYQIALIPLGGYVRILGEDASDEIPPELSGRSFNAKPLWQRIVVVFAGPAANLILPVLIYFVVFAGRSELPAAVVGDVLADSPASRAGIEPGDRVVGIDGHSVRYWEELERAVQGGIGAELKLRIRRNEREIEKYIRPVPHNERSRDGRAARQGYIGITRAPFPPLVGVIDPASPAGRIGLTTSDRIISVDGNAVGNWTTLRRQVTLGMHARNVVYFRGTSIPGAPHVRLLDARTAQLVPEPLTADDGISRPYTGIEPAELVVAHVAPGTPADLAGLRVGDFLESLDGERVQHWVVFDQLLQSKPDHTWTIVWRRYSPEKHRVLEMSAQVKQVSRRQFDDYGNTVERLVFGATTTSDRGQGEMVPIRGRVSYAARKAVDRTGETITTMVSDFWSILAGKASGDSVGGPLMMYRVASVSGHKGWETFLLMMALISVNLGLINLLPVPVLDGGHLLVFAVEAVRRRPLSLKTRERIQLVGLAVVAIITVLALRNDVMRYVIR
jgi:regulator of sigma E protease